MRAQFIGRAFLFAVSLVIAFPASAATTFEGIQIDYRSGRSALNVEVIVDRDAMRADVIVDGQYQVSLIESADRVVALDHVTHTYIIFHPISAAAIESTWLSTERSQSAMGGYCRIVKMQLSATLSQERCLMSAIYVGDADAIDGAHAVAEFLAIVAQDADVATLFDRVVALIDSTSVSRGFPAIVRSFTGGVATSELRLVRVSSTMRARDAFKIPAGFRRTPHSDKVSIQASANAGQP